MGVRCNIGRKTQPAELRAIICEEVRRGCVEAYAGKLASIVLTGSVARDEGTFAIDPDRIRLLGDAEFMVVFQDGMPLPLGAEAAALSRALEASLAEQGLQCRLDLCPTYAHYFRKVAPSIFNYELRTCGKVVWGQDALALMPPFSSEDIPLEDGFRTLCNRTIELLGTLADCSNRRQTGYAAVKLLLDMGTSLLLFSGAYVPGYAARQTRLEELAATRGREPGWPFPLADFARLVTRWTGWKILCGQAEVDRAQCPDVLQWLQPLWRWELERLGYGSGKEMDLWDKWRRRESLVRRLRGWLYVARRTGWHRGIRYWPHWATLAWRGSPRAWIYRTASELAFASSVGGMGSIQVGDLGRLAGYLPQPTAARDWRQLCAVLFANYSDFLVGTLA